MAAASSVSRNSTPNQRGKALVMKIGMMLSALNM